MPKFIVKGWEKCGITRVTSDYQLQAREVNANSTLFTNNLEINENMEVEIGSNLATFILNIAKKCFQQLNILIVSIPSFAPSTTKL
jgi:hypothetical protein